jgi:hypothetical protein
MDSNNGTVAPAHLLVPFPSPIPAWCTTRVRCAWVGALARPLPPSRRLDPLLFFSVWRAHVNPRFLSLFPSLLPQRGRLAPLLLSPQPCDTGQGEPCRHLLRDVASPSVRLAARIRHRGPLIWSRPRRRLPLSVSTTTGCLPLCFLHVSPSPCLHGVTRAPLGHHQPPLAAASPEHRRQRSSSATM